MAQRQGIVLGPIATTQRQPKTQLGGVSYKVGVDYQSPLTPPGTYKADIKTLLGEMFVQDVIIRAVHMECLRALINTMNSHYHVYDDYYQVPTYAGAYGDYGYTDTNSGAGDRNTYSEEKASGVPKHGVDRTVLGQTVIDYFDLSYTDVRVPLKGIAYGDKIYADDFNCFRTATAELAKHGHPITDRTAK